MFEDLVQSIVAFVGNLGYMGIVLMMFLESSFFPFPSEVVLIPAGYLASQDQMNLFIVIALGSLGSVLGALFNYFLAFKLGRAFVLRFGKWFFFKEKELQKMEHFFQVHGAISTFVGRLIPGVRQYISLPAGLAGMPRWKFAFYTFLGATIWGTVLVLLGYFIGQNSDLVSQMLSNATLVALLLVFLGVLYYIWRHKKKQADI